MPPLLLRLLPWLLLAPRLALTPFALLLPDVFFEAGSGLLGCATQGLLKSGPWKVADDASGAAVTAGSCCSGCCRSPRGVTLQRHVYA